MSLCLTDFGPVRNETPFDRLLISQAQVESIPIISNDAKFKGYPIVTEW